MKLSALSGLVRKLMPASEITPSAQRDLIESIQHNTSPLYQQPNTPFLEDAIIVALSELNPASNHDNLRIQRYMLALALELQQHPNFQTFLNDATIELLFKIAPIHDIGEYDVPLSIRNKPGRLSTDERQLLKQHTLFGSQALAAAQQELTQQYPFLQLAHDITASHHEKWDGSGYPAGLQQDAIPMAARMMALIDVYNALTQTRSYQAARSHQQAVEVIKAERGKHFDPDIVDAFLNIEQQFHEISQGESELH